MKRKKLTSLCLAIWMLITGVFLFVACGDDDIPINRDDDGDNVELVRAYLIGTWVVVSSTDNALSNVNFTIWEDGTALLVGIAATYTCSQQEDGSVQLNFYQDNFLLGRGVIQVSGDETSGYSAQMQFDVYQFGIHIAGGNMVVASKGNVLTGAYRMEGSMMPSFITLKKQEYTYPEGGVLGRWKMISCSKNPRRVGEIFVVEDNSELYAEGTPSIYSYTQTNTIVEGEEESLMEVFMGDMHFSGVLHFFGDQVEYVFEVEGEYNEYTATFVRC